MESRDLRTFVTFQVNQVRRSLDSLRSLGMTSFVSVYSKLQNIDTRNNYEQIFF